MKVEAIDLLLKSDSGCAKRLDACSGGGHFDEVVVTQVVDGVEACTGLICRCSLL